MMAIDLYCGLGGWAEGLLAEGYTVVGFDIERHDYGTGGYPGQLVLQNATTLHGSQFKDATVIVASPPCQEYSYMAMPWSPAKQIAAALRGKGEFPEEYSGSRTVAELNRLFEACFRIHREANAANRCATGGEGAMLRPGDCLDCSGTGNFYRNDEDGDYLPCDTCGGGYGETSGKRRYIPLIVENVWGAQRWVGRAKANFGSYYLWGDVGMVGKRVVAGVPRFGVSVQPMGKARKVPGISFNGEFGSTSPGFNVTAAQRYREGVKHGGDCFNDPTWAGKQGGSKQPGISGPRNNGKGDKWFQDGAVRHGSKSDSRKAASAEIAKIPFPLAQYIARCFKTHAEVCA
jgi:hypothetical protein